MLQTNPPDHTFKTDSWGGMRYQVRAKLLADGTVEARAVQTKDAYLGWCPVLEGLAEGETVVISGVAKLTPGAKVRDVAPTANEDITADFKPRAED